jgi:hypothetical protein
MVARPFLAMAAGWWWRRLSLWGWGWGGGCKDGDIARGLTGGGGLAALLRSLACLSYRVDWTTPTHREIEVIMLISVEVGEL